MSSVVCLFFSSLCLSDQMFHIWFFTCFCYWKIRIFVLLFSVSLDIFIVTIIFTMFVCGDIKSYPCISKSPTFVNAKSTEHNIMERFLSIFKQKQELPVKTIDEQKTLLHCFTTFDFQLFWYSSSKLFGIRQKWKIENV